MAKIGVIDAETDPFKLGRKIIKPFVWGFYNGDMYKEIWNTHTDKEEIHNCTDVLFDFLESLDEPHIIYAHNGGKFDFHFILDKFPVYAPIKIINGRIASIKVGIHELRDSYSLLPVPLGSYKKDEIDYDLMEANVRFIPENKKIISSYLNSDCVYLYDLVAGFIERYGMSMTMAGMAMKKWEEINKREDEDFVAPKTTPWFYEAFKPFYYGGRVQCFRSGIINTRFEYVDINSAYPHAMLQMHPVSPDYDEFGPVAGVRLAAILRRPYMGNLFFDIDAVSGGALPYRSQIDHALHFPNDRKTRRYFVTGWEVKAALETNSLKIVNVHNIYEFDVSGCMDFSNYINPFYNERLDAKAAGDDRLSLWTKLFMNSLYGKFGANPDEYAHYLIVPHHMKNSLILSPHTPDEINEFVENDLDGWHFSGEIGPYVLAEKELERHEKRFYNVATAASITGCVRAYLWRAIKQARGLIYCDTDSIVAESFGTLPYGKQLGEWERVAANEKKGAHTYTFGAVGGKKMYAFRDEIGEWKKASKGVRLSVPEIIDVAQGKNVLYIPSAPTFSVHKPPSFIERNVRLTSRVLLD